ncbi:MAG TPA: ABC transporter ATP-binding protein [Candidatus Paenibacillus intestinavium]|nr:ABC transporter ATP-binding protein [Candidatus Paenibacillus intestinavium]
MSYIQLKQVSKTFKQRERSTQALQQIDLQIEQRKFVSLIGPSGCGKSTLLRIIGGLVKGDEGEVTIGGLSPKEAQKQKQFGFVPQSPALFPWRTVLENMNLPFEVNKKAVKVTTKREDPMELLRSVGLGEFAHSYAKELSGGMQQRVGIARAFGSGAPILLMDEPFSALDEITREKISYQLLHIWEAYLKTVVFVTHNIREAVLLSDKVVVMSARPGKITKIINIDLPRPRSADVEESVQFNQYVSEIRGYLRAEWQ